MTGLALVLLLAAAAGATAGPPSAGGVDKAAVAAFGQQHSGSAAGVVAPVATSAGEKKLGGLDAYVAAPPKAAAGSSPTAAVLVFTDVFGIKPQATRAFADKLAAQGNFLVVAPDFFKGGARSKNDTPESFPEWLAKYPRAAVLKDAEQVLADLKKAYPSVKKVGAVGFCWGGLYATLLAGAGAKPAADAALVFHGSLLTPADVQAVARPINFQQSDPALDKQINGTLFKEISSILAQKRANAQKPLDASITSYAGQPHGFSLRGDLGEPAAAAAAAKAFDAGLAFLKKNLA